MGRPFPGYRNPKERRRAAAAAVRRAEIAGLVDAAGGDTHAVAAQLKMPVQSVASIYCSARLREARSAS